MEKKYSVIPHLSMRFFPWWDSNDPRQVVGLLKMTNEIVRLDPRVSTLVEIGSHIGESATLFLGFSNFKKIYCVDPFVVDPFFEKLFNERLSMYFGNRCVPIKLSSERFAKKFKKRLDMVYIDGANEYESVLQDLNLWYPKLRKKGFLCGHDYSDDHSGSKMAIDEFVKANKLRIKIFEDCSWYARKH